MTPAIEARIRAVIVELHEIDCATCDAVDAGEMDASMVDVTEPALASARATLARLLAGPRAVESEVAAAWCKLDDHERRLLGAMIVGLAHGAEEGSLSWDLVRPIVAGQEVRQ